MLHLKLTDKEVITYLLQVKKDYGLMTFTAAINKVVKQNIRSAEIIRQNQLKDWLDNNKN